MHTADDVAKVAAEAAPAGHLAHEDALDEAWKVPGPHGVQAEALTAG